MRFAGAALLAVLASGCASLKSSGQSTSQANAAPAAQGASAQGSVSGKTFAPEQTITALQAQEKNGLSVSYGIQLLPAKKEQEYLVKLSLVFHNLNDQKMLLRPRVALKDSKGKSLSPYSEKGFIKASHQLLNERDGQESAKNWAEWAHTYWLKHSFTIPPHGIQIGEIVFPCPRLNLPMQLTVSTRGERYEFVYEGSPAKP